MKSGGDGALKKKFTCFFVNKESNLGIATREKSAEGWVLGEGVCSSSG